jgi:TfoX/Sxy family transcriptional regulator of competence genes
MLSTDTQQAHGKKRELAQTSMLQLAIIGPSESMQCFMISTGTAGGFREVSMPGPQKPMWQKSSAELVALFAELAPQDPAVTQKKMFGWPCCFVNGNLFTGLHKESMVFRLSDDDRMAFLKLDGAADFEPMPGRKMKGYTTLADPLHRNRKELVRWMERALEHTRSLPAKSKSKPSEVPEKGDDVDWKLVFTPAGVRMRYVRRPCPNPACVSKDLFRKPGVVR